MSKLLAARRTNESKVSAEFAKELLEYQPESGVFYWRVDRAAERQGQIAGFSNGRYWNICINYVHYAAHRLAWLIVTGVWPKDEIDHRNLDKLDNRWINLREATHSQNAHNARKRSDNTSGFKGVSYDKSRGRWRATIEKDGGGQRFVGRFHTAQEAHAAYLRAAIEQFGEFARGE